MNRQNYMALRDPILCKDDIDWVTKVVRLKAVLKEAFMQSAPTIGTLIKYRNDLFLFLYFAEEDNACSAEIANELFIQVEQMCIDAGIEPGYDRVSQKEFNEAIRLLPPSAAKAVLAAEATPRAA